MANRFLSNIKINDAYTFPASDGTNGQVIKTDGSGNLSFAQLAADSASVMYKDTFTGNGSATAFTLANALNDEVQSNVYIDGVYQSKSTYSVSGTTLTFSTAPASGHEIEVISTTGINSGPTAIYTDTFTANGSATAFTLGQTVHDENQTIVFLNGVYQFKGTYTLSGTTLTLDTAPANGVAIEVMSIGSAYSGGDILYDHDFGSAGLMTTNGSGVYSITANNSANWNTAYGWGDHSTQSYATQSYVGTQISNLVDSSPATLNTLNELAAALGDDPNFATTTANSIGTKMPLAGGTFTGNVSLIASSAINLRVTDGTQNIYVGSSGNTRFGLGAGASIIQSTGAIFGVGTQDGNSLILGTNNTAAITIDTSQNATFAGDVIGSASILNIKNNDIRFKTTGAETMLRAVANGAVELMYNNSVKFATTNTGVTVTGSGTFTGIITASSSSSGDYVRLYGSSGTGKWDIYGNGANLRISDNESAGILVVDTGATFGGDVTLNKITTSTGLEYQVRNTNGASGNHVFKSYNTAILILDGGTNNSTFAGEVTLSAETQYLNFKKASTADILATIISETDAGTGGKIRILTKRNGDTAINALTIDDNQNVGIGTTSPSAKLNVIDGNNTFVTSDANAYARLTVAGGSVQLGLFRSNSNVGGGYIGADGNTCFHVRDASFATKLYLTQGGDLGIGTTSPSYKLHVSGTGGTRMSITNTDTNWAALQIQAKGNQADYIFFKDDTEERARIAALDSSDLVFYNTDSVTERMRITAAGNLAIGASSSAERVTIAGVGSLYPNIKFTFPGVTSRFMKIGMESAVKYEFHVNGSGTYMSFATEGTEKMRITSSAEGHVELSGTAPVIKATASNGGSGLRINVAAQSGGQLFRVQEDGSTKFTVTENGNVEVGVANSTSNGAILYGGTAGGIIYSFRDSNSPGSVFRWYTGGTMVGSVSTTGSATSFNTSSDYRLKENVIKMTGALDRVSQLKPSRFNFIIDPNKTVDGFLAHEVQSIVPEAISGEKDAVDEDGNPEYQGIDQSKLVPLLVGAIQELKAEIETLKTQINGSD